MAAASLLRELRGRAEDGARMLEQLEARLARPRQVLSRDVVSFLAWAWQHRRELELEDAAHAWPQQPQAAQEVWAALDGAVRATGMVEDLGSILAPHRAAHRGLPDNLLAVFRVYRNHAEGIGAFV